MDLLMALPVAAFTSVATATWAAMCGAAAAFSLSAEASVGLASTTTAASSCANYRKYCDYSFVKYI